MFFVRETRAARTEKILSFVDNQTAIAVLLATMDFEWSCRRVILALGKSPTKQLKSKEGFLGSSIGLDSYKKAWNNEVYPITGDRLHEVIPDWEFFYKKAYPLRHRLIHGVIGSIDRSYALPRINSILKASEALADYANNHGTPIFGRRIDRRKAR